jgi:hypothetical protein
MNNNNNSEDVMTDENEGKTSNSNDSSSLFKCIYIEHNYLSDYGMKWLKAWWETNNFKKWNQFTDHEIYEIVEPG